MRVSNPAHHNSTCLLGAAVARFLGMEKVNGSIPLGGSTVLMSAP